MVCASSVAILFLLGLLSCIQGLYDQRADLWTQRLDGERTLMCTHKFREQSPRIMYRFPTTSTSEENCKFECIGSKFEGWEGRIQSEIVGQVQHGICHCHAKGHLNVEHYLIPFRAGAGCSPELCWTVFVKAVDIAQLIQAEEKVGTIDSYETSCEECWENCESSLDIDIDLQKLLESLQMVQNSEGNTNGKLDVLNELRVDISQVVEDIQRITNDMADQDRTEALGESNSEKKPNGSAAVSEEAEGMKQNTSTVDKASVPSTDDIERTGNGKKSNTPAADSEDCEGKTSTVAKADVQSTKPPKLPKLSQMSNQNLTAETWELTTCWNVFVEKATTPWMECPPQKLWWCAYSASAPKRGKDLKPGYCVCMRREQYDKHEQLQEEAARLVSKSNDGGGAPRAKWCHRVPEQQALKYKQEVEKAKGAKKKT